MEKTPKQARVAAVLDIMNNFPVLSGRVTEGHAEYIVKAIEETDWHNQHINHEGLRNWIAKEIRLAMQQEMSRGRHDGMGRAAIAMVRTRRILAKLDGFHVPDKPTVSDPEIRDYIETVTPR